MAEQNVAEQIVTSRKVFTLPERIDRGNQEEQNNFY